MLVCQDKWVFVRTCAGQLGLMFGCQTLWQFQSSIHRRREACWDGTQLNRDFHRHQKQNHRATRQIRDCFNVTSVHVWRLCSSTSMCVHENIPITDLLHGVHVPHPYSAVSGHCGDPPSNTVNTKAKNTRCVWPHECTVTAATDIQIPKIPCGCGG